MLPNRFHVCSALIIRERRLRDLRHQVAADLFILGFRRAPFENPNKKNAGQGAERVIGDR